MTSKWIYNHLSKEQIDIQNKLSEALNISPVLSSLLVQRDILTFEDARRFFRPDLADLHDPFLLADMDKAVNRLTEAVRNNEKFWFTVITTSMELPPFHWFTNLSGNFTTMCSFTYTTVIKKGMGFLIKASTMQLKIR